MHNISLFFMNTIIKTAIDEEHKVYSGLTNALFELEYNSNMRRLGYSKNKYKFHNTLLYLGMIESTLKSIKDDDK